MSRKVSFIVGRQYSNNKIFDANEPSRIKYRALKIRFNELGFEVGTHDVISPAGADIVIYVDVLPALGERRIKCKRYLVAMESPIIEPRLFCKQNHSAFSKVFTWNDELVDNSKYIKTRYAIKFKHDGGQEFSERKDFAMVFSNRFSSRNSELYSFRRRIIDWFERVNPDKFSLYGRGWDSRRSKYRIINLLYGFSFFGKTLGRFIGNNLTTYKGEVTDKLEVMSSYKFIFCPENVEGWSGYITEKVLDAINGGAVPIYTGAPNICDYIPGDLIVSFSKDSNVEDLFNNLMSFDEIRFSAYQKLCREYILGAGEQLFGIDQFVNTIVETILSDIDRRN